jgi:tetratricopeptide (TPR) repeat protein
MGYLILVCTVSVISVIAFTCVSVTGVMGATTYTTIKVNATTNTTLHKSGVPKPSRDFLTPYYKGMAYLNTGNYTEAITYFDKALAISPNYSLTLNNKGAALYGLGIYNESIAYFDKALSVNPRYTTALYNKAATLSKLGIYNESIAYFDKVLAIQPTNPFALAGKKLDLAAFSKTNIIAEPIGTIATPQIPQTSDFGYYFQKRNINETAPPLTNAHKRAR